MHYNYFLEVTNFFNFELIIGQSYLLNKILSDLSMKNNYHVLRYFGFIIFVIIKVMTCI